LKETSSVKRFIPLFAAAALSVAAPVAAFAHGPTSGPHGGVMADAGSYHVEFTAQGDDIMLYVSDGDGKPLDVTGAKAEATVLVDKKAHKITLSPAGSPAGGNLLKGRAALGGAGGLKAVVVLTMPGQKPVQARFDLTPVQRLP
jgi:hypothetical protein